MLKTLTFQLNNNSDIQLVITLIEKLGGTIDFADKMENFKEDVDNTELFGIPDKIAEKGKLSKSMNLFNYLLLLYKYVYRTFVSTKGKQS